MYKTQKAKEEKVTEPPLSSHTVVPVLPYMLSTGTLIHA